MVVRVDDLRDRGGVGGGFGDGELPQAVEGLDVLVERSIGGVGG